MKGKHLIIIVLTVAVPALQSCTKQRLQSTYNSQETSIEKYLNTQLQKDTTRYVVHNAGSNRLVTKEGTGEELMPGGTLVFTYAGYTFSGSISSSNLFATNDSTSAKSAGWNTTMSEISFKPDTLTLSKDNFINGLYNGLCGVQAGEECQILFSGEYGFGNKKTGTVSANAALAYYIWVKSVKNN